MGKHISSPVLSGTVQLPGVKEKITVLWGEMTCIWQTLTEIQEEPFASTITVDKLEDTCHTLMIGAAVSSEMLEYVYQNKEHHDVGD